MNKSRFIWALCLILSALICFGSGCTTAINPEVIGEGEVEIVSPEEISNGGNQGGNQGGTDTPIVPDEPFVPDINDTDDKVQIGGDYDFSTQYDYTGATLTTVNGSFSVGSDSNGTTYVATTGNALSVNMGSTGIPFPYGTMSADVVNNTSDSGIVFGLSSTRSYFWEGTGISYYFYFVSFQGYIYLGKADNGGWSALCNSTIPNWSGSTSYNLKVVYKGTKILCFLNDEYVFSYSESTPLKGTGWGVRAGASGASIKNVKISSSFTY